MSDQEKPGITINFREPRNGLYLAQIKKILLPFTAVIIAMAVSESLLTLTEIIKITSMEVALDILILLASFIVLAFVTFPFRHYESYRKRSIAMLKIALLLLCIQIAAIFAVSYIFHDIGQTDYFLISFGSVIVYNGAFLYLTRRYRFTAKFLSINIPDAIRLRKDSDGNIQSVERSDLISEETRDLIQRRLRSEITEGELIEAVLKTDPVHREFILSFTRELESKIRKKHRW